MAIDNRTSVLCHADDAQYNIDAVVRERLFYIRMKCHVVRKGTKTRQTGYLVCCFISLHILSILV